MQVVGSTYQAMQAPNMSTYIGAGKVAEVGWQAGQAPLHWVLGGSVMAPDAP